MRAGESTISSADVQGGRGDPGESTFFVSLEDDLMRLFGSEKVQRMMDALQVGDEVVLDYKMMSSAIENAQRRVEGRHFQTRKSVLEYDDVMNRQREIIYGQRRTVLDGEDIHQQIITMINDSIDRAAMQVSGGSQHLSRLQADQLLSRFRNAFIGPLERMIYR